MPCTRARRKRTKNATSNTATLDRVRVVLACVYAFTYKNPTSVGVPSTESGRLEANTCAVPTSHDPTSAEVSFGHGRCRHPYIFTHLYEKPLVVVGHVVYSGRKRLLLRHHSNGIDREVLHQ